MTVGCVLGVLDMDPIIEYWDASKTKTIKKSNGTNVSLNGDFIYTWQSSNGKRKFANIVTLTTDLATYSNSTEWPAVHVVYPAYQMSQSGFLFENGETVFMVIRSVTSGIFQGFCKTNSSTIPGVNAWNSTAFNGMFMTSTGYDFRVVTGGVETTLTMGNVGTLPYLTVLSMRIFQSGTSIIIWTMGNTGVVVTKTLANQTWSSNTNRNTYFELELNAGTMNCYYLEINRSIKTTAQMLARRNVLYNLYAT
jgi:hypothetical protein